ncbi:MAG: aldo/keto reductase [Alphaproteobacteria bacterium]|nr:aldo/keto reductase [Alphaproteobacteria bacterium]
MQYRTLGRSGLTVSEIGFGAWGIGGVTSGATSYGAQDDAVSLAALDQAIVEGLTFFDTANVYGDGNSEVLIGKAIAGQRDKVVIATKAGFTTYDQAPNYSPDWIRHSLEGSLTRLGTSYVDLLQLHIPPLDLLRQDGSILDTLRGLVSEGQIRTFGLSVKGVDEGIAAITEFAVPVLQVNLNMLDIRAVTSSLFALAADRGTGIIARTPLCFGFLTGTLTADSEFPADDHRSTWPRVQIRAWADGAAAALALVEARPGQTAVNKALRYCLSYPEVSTVIPGLLTPEQVDEAAATSRLGPLSMSERGAIEHLNAVCEFFVRR